MATSEEVDRHLGFAAVYRRREDFTSTNCFWQKHVVRPDKGIPFNEDFRKAALSPSFCEAEHTFHTDSFAQGSI